MKMYSLEEAEYVFGSIKQNNKIKAVLLVRPFYVHNTTATYINPQIKNIHSE